MWKYKIIKYTRLEMLLQNVSWFTTQFREFTTCTISGELDHDQTWFMSQELRRLVGSPGHTSLLGGFWPSTTASIYQLPETSCYFYAVVDPCVFSTSPGRDHGGARGSDHGEGKWCCSCYALIGLASWISWTWWIWDYRSLLFRILDTGINDGWTWGPQSLCAANACKCDVFFVAFWPKF